LDNLCLWKKRQFLRLNEALQLTQQLAQALDRKDQVSVRMVLSMRQEPIQQAEEMEETLKNYLYTLPEEDAIRLHELLSGAPAESPLEQPLCDQIQSNRRLLKQITDLDRNLSLRLGGNKSFYKMFREK